MRERDKTTYIDIRQVPCHYPHRLYFIHRPNPCCSIMRSTGKIVSYRTKLQQETRHIKLYERHKDKEISIQGRKGGKNFRNGRYYQTSVEDQSYLNIPYRIIMTLVANKICIQFCAPQANCNRSVFLRLQEVWMQNIKIKGKGRNRDKQEESQ